MRATNQSPFTHGMEVEQFPTSYLSGGSSGVPEAVFEQESWHLDGSGPQETDYGAYKSAKSVLNAFYRDTRDEGHTWDWHNHAGRGGCGSHVHLCVAEDVPAWEADNETTKAWTIAYNTAVELTPFFAPFWCHDWENGFRSSVTQWAPAETRRYSVASMEQARRSHSGRAYQAVTLNAAYDKPLTIELRLNEAHPAMAVPGSLLMRHVTGKAMEWDWSVKLEDRSQLDEVYDVIYNRARRVGLLTAMQEELPSGPIRFAEDRGIPGRKKQEFDTPYDVFLALSRQQHSDPDYYMGRAQLMAESGVDAVGPQNNQHALWTIDQDEERFYWEAPPEGATQAARREPGNLFDLAGENSYLTDLADRRAAAGGA